MSLWVITLPRYPGLSLANIDSDSNQPLFRVDSLSGYDGTGIGGELIQIRVPQSVTATVQFMTVDDKFGSGIVLTRQIATLHARSPPIVAFVMDLGNEIVVRMWKRMALIVPCTLLFVSLVSMLRYLGATNHENSPGTLRAQD